MELGRDHPGEPVAILPELTTNLMEALADVLDQGLVVSAKLDVTPEMLFRTSEAKLAVRFKH